MSPWWGRRGSVAVRLTVVATLATTVVLTVVLAGVLTLFSRQLDVSVRDGLRARLADLQAGVAGDDSAVLGAESLAQLLDRGRVVASSGGLPPGARLVEPGALRCPGSRLLDRRLRRAGKTDQLRVLVQCLPDGRQLAVAVDVTPQREAQARLLELLAVAGPLLLLLLAAAVGRAVRAALRPVDLLTREAATISAGPDTRRRLPTVAGDDEIARLASTLDAMLARLAVAFEREQSFVDDASHELRTPIAVLRGELELALCDLGDSQAVEQSLQAALAEAERLSRLVQDLLVLARLGTPPPPAAPQQLTADVSTLLASTAERLAGLTGLQLSVQSPSGLAVSCDPERLESALVNLVTNAAAAGAAAVRLGAHAQDDLVHLEVADDGPGFDPAFLPVAFERFSRADLARGPGGSTGLGLAIVAATARAAGGSVTARNDGPLGGAVLRVSLPRAHPARPPTPASRPQERR